MNSVYIILKVINFNKRYELRVETNLTLRNMIDLVADVLRIDKEDILIYYELDDIFLDLDKKIKELGLYNFIELTLFF